MKCSITCGVLQHFMHKENGKNKVTLSDYPLCMYLIAKVVMVKVGE